MNDSFVVSGGEPQNWISFAILYASLIGSRTAEGEGRPEPLQMSLGQRAFIPITQPAHHL